MYLIARPAKLALQVTTVGQARHSSYEKVPHCGMYATSGSAVSSRSARQDERKRSEMGESSFALTVKYKLQIENASDLWYNF